MAKIEASVIIPAFNAQQTIENCVRSALKNPGDNFEVIVVNDCSQDATGQILGAIKDKRLRCLYNSVNRGASFARNRGIKNSQGDIVILLDADSFVEQDWVKQHLEAHKNIPASIIGGGVKGVAKTVWGKCDGFCNWWVCIPNSKNCYIRKLHLPTNNLSIKREVFAKIGYLNENLKTGEDAEFCFRALQNGQKIFLKSDLLVFHHDKDSFKDFLRHQAAWGKHALKMRKDTNMDFSWLMPKSKLAAYLSIPHLSVLYTGFIILKWIRYDIAILWLWPLILLGKIAQAESIAQSFNSVS
jgi:glycosyltransferase involved in cell wall biosynthesis